MAARKQRDGEDIKDKIKIIIQRHDFSDFLQ